MLDAAAVYDALVLPLKVWVPVARGGGTSCARLPESPSCARPWVDLAGRLFPGRVGLAWAALS